MRGVNKAIIVGTLGADPEGISFPDGGMITNFSVATSEVWNDNNGNRQENTQWHRIRLNGKLADLGLRLLKKGSKVYIEGSIRTRKWNDDKGQARYTTEIHAERIEVLDLPAFNTPKENTISPSVHNNVTSNQIKPDNNPFITQNFDKEDIPF